MKTFLLSTLFVMATTSTATLAAGNTTDIFSLSNGKDHMLTASHAEIRSASRLGYYNEGLAFKLLSKKKSGTRALYRCRIGSNHFVSTSSNCEGQVTEGILGYLYSSETGNSEEIIRCFSGKDHHATANYNCDSGYKYEGVLGYAPVGRGGGHTRFDCQGQKILWDDYDLVSPRNRNRNVCKSRIGKGQEGDIKKIFSKGQQDGWIKLECVDGQWEPVIGRRGNLKLECFTDFDDDYDDFDDIRHPRRRG